MPRNAARRKRSRVDRSLSRSRRSECRGGVGEGGSGGAIAIATANRVLMLEHAIYSVISPKARPRSCGATRQGAGSGDNMKITAQDLQRFGVIDEMWKSRSAARIAIRQW